ncbi:MAG TPA: helix-turn-helix domain-containing protein [Solirubrobacterales bacterium]|nr:helix-turn-helix domain-containing protein [Solirubrobacterales bacterium]
MTAKKTKKPPVAKEVDQRLIRALGHPVRDRILRALNERVASPAVLAREWGEPVVNVAYHFRVLRDCDAIELVRREQRRGALEHFYRATLRPYLGAAEWESLPLSTRRALDAQNLRELWSHVTQAAGEGGFDDPGTHISWTRLELDDEAFAKVAGELGRLLERALELQGEVANRRAGDDTSGQRRTELAILHFDRPAMNGDGPTGNRRTKKRRP